MHWRLLAAHTKLQSHCQVSNSSVPSELDWLTIQSRPIPAESETIEDFGKALHLMRSDLEHLRNILIAVESGDIGLLKSMGIRDSELTDLKLFLDKLVTTGFMD